MCKSTLHRASWKENPPPSLHQKSTEVHRAPLDLPSMKLYALENVRQFDFESNSLVSAIIINWLDCVCISFGMFAVINLTIEFAIITNPICYASTHLYIVCRYQTCFSVYKKVHMTGNLRQTRNMAVRISDTAAFGRVAKC